MISILQKISTKSKSEIIHDMVAQREKKQYCIVDFLYFANIVRTKLLKNWRKNSFQKQYQKALEEADFLLPDGIALQIFYWCATRWHKRLWLANCNGTDLTLPLLEALQKKYNKNCVISLYGWTNNSVKKSAQFLRNQWYTTCYIQDGYTTFDRNKFLSMTTQNNAFCHVLLVGRWTPKQEIWVHDEQEQIKKYHLLTLCVGWLFDFWSGEEKRTPVIFRWWTERLRRLCLNPRKNAIKVRYSMSLFWYSIRYSKPLRKSWKKKIS